MREGGAEESESKTHYCLLLKIYISLQSVFFIGVHTYFQEKKIALQQ